MTVLSRKLSEVEERKKGYLARRVETSDRERVEAGPIGLGDSRPRAEDPDVPADPVSSCLPAEELEDPLVCLLMDRVRPRRGHGQRSRRRRSWCCLALPSALGLRRQAIRRRESRLSRVPMIPRGERENESPLGAGHWIARLRPGLSQNAMYANYSLRPECVQSQRRKGFGGDGPWTLCLATLSPAGYLTCEHPRTKRR
jgi:hypothetical protein